MPPSIEMDLSKRPVQFDSSMEFRPPLKDNFARSPEITRRNLHS